MNTIPQIAFVLGVLILGGCQVTKIGTPVDLQSEPSAELVIKPLSFSDDPNWQEYPLPRFTLSDKTEKNQPEMRQLWYQVDQPLIAEISHNVARILYADAEQAPQIPTLEVIWKNFNGIAYKAGNFDGVTVTLSADYFAKYLNKNGVVATQNELIGVLYHEIAHGFQMDDNNYKNIGPLIEGIADVVRYQAGYVDLKDRKLGGNYDTGYKTTALFLAWLEETEYPGLLQQLNLSLDASDDITWDWPILEKQLGKPLDKLWQQYQTTLSGSSE